MLSPLPEHGMLSIEAYMCTSAVVDYHVVKALCGRTHNFVLMACTIHSWSLNQLGAQVTMQLLSHARAGNARSPGDYLSCAKGPLTMQLCRWSGLHEGT